MEKALCISPNYKPSETEEQCVRQNKKESEFWGGGKGWKCRPSHNIQCHGPWTSHNIQWHGSCLLWFSSRLLCHPGRAAVGNESLVRDRVPLTCAFGSLRDCFMKRTEQFILVMQQTQKKCFSLLKRILISLSVADSQQKTYIPWISFVMYRFCYIKLTWL